MGWASELRGPEPLGSGENPPPGCRWPTSHRVLRQLKDNRWSPGPFLQGHSSSLWGLHLHDPVITEISPNTTKRELGLHYMNSRGNKNIQFIAWWMKFTAVHSVGTKLQRMGFPDSSVGKESACNAGDPSLIPGSGRSHGEGKGYPLQYSGLENSMDCIVLGVAKSQTWLNDFHFHIFTKNGSVMWNRRIRWPQLVKAFLVKQAWTESQSFYWLHAWAS